MIVAFVNQHGRVGTRNTRANVARDLTQALADDDPPVLKNSITECAVFAEIMKSGRLAFELPHSSAAAQEVVALAAQFARIAS